MAPLISATQVQSTRISQILDPCPLLRIESGQDEQEHDFIIPRINVPNLVKLRQRATSDIDNNDTNNKIDIDNNHNNDDDNMNMNIQQ